MQIITGIGESEHVTSMQHRAIFEMVIGNDSYILNKGELLKPELQSNNALKIRSGMLAHHGCISEVAPNTYDEVAIGNGSQNMKRIDLVVARYTQNAETKVERTEWTVIQGQPVESNPVAPDYIHGNMQDGDLTDDCPVFEVHLDGIQVVEIKKLLNVLDGSLAELNRNFSNALGMLSNIKGIYVGSKISACNQTYALLHDEASLTKILGKAPTTNNFVCMVMNGDANAAQTSYYSPRYYSGDGLYVYVYPNVTGNIRINYMIFAIG